MAREVGVVPTEIEALWEGGEEKVGCTATLTEAMDPLGEPDSLLVTFIGYSPGPLPDPVTFESGTLTSSVLEETAKNEPAGRGVPFTSTRVVQIKLVPVRYTC